MPLAKRIIAIDIGSHSLKLAEFAFTSAGRIQLVHYGQSDFYHDGHVSSNNRGADIQRAIKQILAEHRIQSNQVLVSISSQSVLMRGVKLPPVDAAQIEKMIGFEAQQIIPFPLDEMAWDYQMVPSRDGTSEEAFIVAVKKEILEPDCIAIAECKLNVQYVDAGPLALYNAYRFNYGHHPECVLILDIGAKATNLLFIEGDSFYSRSVPIAGNQISQLIASEFQEPYQAGETLKKGKGYVNLGNNYADTGDPISTRISHLIRNTMLKLHGELARSINFYRTQQGGASPVRIYLTGGSAMIPYLDIFLADKMKLNVEYFNPLKNIDLHPSIDREAFRAKTFFVSELVGLALRAASQAPVEICLHTPWIIKRNSEIARFPYLVLSLATLFLFLALLSLAAWREISITESLLEKARNENTQFQGYLKNLEPKEKQLDQIQHYLDQAKVLGIQRQSWNRILNDLHHAIPIGVWITQLTPLYNGYGMGDLVPVAKPSEPTARGQKGGNPSQDSISTAKPAKPTQINELRIKGFFEKNLQPGVINTFVTALAESEFFDINTEKITDAIISTETPQDSDSLGWSYELKVKLKEPISIQP
jgi:type IV pilus assembly protein PilM